VIILTSNLGTEFLAKKHQPMQGEVMAAVRRISAPNFNRLDEIILFYR